MMLLAAVTTCAEQFGEPDRIDLFTAALDDLFEKRWVLNDLWGALGLGATHFRGLISRGPGRRVSWGT